MHGRRGVLIGLVLVAACSGSSATNGSDGADGGGGEPVPLVGVTDQGMRVRIDVVGEREVHVRIPVDCEPDEPDEPDESDDADQTGEAQDVPLQRLLPDLDVDEDGSFRIEDTVVEDGTDGDELHVDLRLEGRFDRDGTASGTVEATQRGWNGQAESFSEPCRTGEVGWTATEPPRSAPPDATVPLPAGVMTTLPLGDGVLLLLADGRLARVDAAGDARHLDGSPVAPPEVPTGGDGSLVAPGAEMPTSTDAAVAGEGVWVGGSSGADRHGLADGAPTARIDGHLEAIEAGHGALWTVTFDRWRQHRTLDKRDPATGAVLASAPVLTGPLLVDASGVWYAYATWEDQVLDRFDPATATVVDHHVLDTEVTPSDLATTADRVWLLYRGYGRSDTLVALDPATGTLAPVDLPTTPDAMAPADDGTSVWSLHPREAVARRIDAAGQVVEILDVPDGWWQATTTPGALWLTGRDRDGLSQVLRLPT